MPTKSFVEFIEKAGIRKYFKDSRFNPVSKTSSMTSPVGVDPVTGELYSTPYSLSDMTPFKITMLDAPGGYSIDKSFSEIKTAYTNGRKVFLDVGDDTLEIVPSVFENPTFFNFSLIYISQADISAPKYVISKFASIYSDNSINYAVRTMSESSITGDYLPLDGGVMQGDIDLGSNKILFEGGVAELAIDPESEILSIKSGGYYDRLRVAHPVDNDNDVATKKYVDDHSGGGGGTSDHSQLTNRDAINQHPMSAITGLANELGSINDAFADVFRNLNNKLSDAPIDNKQYARKNGAWAVVQSGGGADNAVLYTPQSLTEAQKAQARTNIGAGTGSGADSATYHGLYDGGSITLTDVPEGVDVYQDFFEGLYFAGKNVILSIEEINGVWNTSFRLTKVGESGNREGRFVLFSQLEEYNDSSDMILATIRINTDNSIVYHATDLSDSYDMVIRLNGTGEFSPNAYTATILRGTADALWNKASSDSYGDVPKILLLINSYYADTIIKTKRVVYPDVWHDVHEVNAFQVSLVPDPVNRTGYLSLYYFSGTMHVSKSDL